MDAEYKWVEGLVRGSNSSIVFSHNDLHGGNIMARINEDGSYDPDSIQIIDYDNAEFGYRAFDFEYHFSHWNSPGPTDEQITDFVQHYLSVWNAASSTQLTVDQIIYELEQHRPYVLMEQMIFFRNRY